MEETVSRQDLYVLSFLAALTNYVAVTRRLEASVDAAMMCGPGL